MRHNPFANTLDIAGRALTARSNIRIIYQNLPPGMGAGYQFADPPKNPKPVILLPKADTSNFNSHQKMKWCALLTHELLHHDRSGKKDWDRAVADGRFVKDLTNCLEDARIEIDKQQQWVSIGAFEDLFRYRMEKLHEMENDAEGAMNNPWGWLFQVFKHYLPNYGMLPIPEKMKDYFDIGMDILNKNDRFMKAADVGSKGSKVTTDLAIELAEAWQQRRDEDFEPNEKENDDDKDELEHDSDDCDDDDDDSDDDVDSESKGKDSESEGDDSESEGDDSGSNGNNSGSEKDNRSSDGEDQSSEGDDQEGDGKAGSDPDAVNKKSQKGKSEDDETEDQADETDNGSGCDASEEDGADPTESGSEDEESGDGVEPTEGDGESDDDSRTEDESGSGDNEGDDDDLSQPADEDGRPQDIKNEYGEDQEGDDKMDTDTLGQEVAGIATDDDGDTGSWDPNNTSEDIDDEYRDTPDWEGDPYIPYTKEDREIVPKAEPNAYSHIVSDVGPKILSLRRTLTRILAAQTNTTIERGFRTGRMDSHLFYKIPRGGRRVKTQITEGKNLNTAVTLLLDLSGSMSGSKAQLAVRIGSLFGEAMTPIPNIEFEILGYNSSPLSYNGRTDAHTGGYTRTEIINYWIFKTFEEPWALTRNRLGACTKSFNDEYPEQGGACDGCNVDHENVIHAARRLYERKETNKVLIVICDGAPSGYNGSYGGLLDTKLEETVQRVRDADIKTFCFGIQSPRVERYYAPDFHLVNNINDLDELALRKLGEYLLGRK